MNQIPQENSSTSKDKRATKRNVAMLISSLYPELSEYAPTKVRILWKERDFYWLNVFDACTLALAYLKEKVRGRGSQIK